MDDIDLNNLRAWLDEQEAYARSVAAGSPQAAIAREMLQIIAEARKRLVPSGHGTANYVPTKQFFEQLGALRMRAEQRTGRTVDPPSDG